MPDRRFFRIDREWTLGDLAAALAIEAPPDTGAQAITGVASLRSAGAGDLAYYADPRERAAFEASAAGAILISPALAASGPAPAAALIGVSDPAAAFAEAVRLLYGESLRQNAAGSGGTIAADAEIGEDVRLASGVVIGAGARIGADSEIGPGSIIGPGVEIGTGARIGAHVSVYFCIAGRALTLASGARIGEAGFGFRQDGAGGFTDFPQLGRVLIGDHVSVGANSCIDRGALDDTVIGDWCRIDNLVQVGHNVRMGARCILAGMVGIAGSVTLGDDVRMGGQAGVIDHLQIGDGALIAGGAFVSRDVPPDAKISGVPGIPLRQKQRELVLLKRMVAGGGGEQDDDNDREG